MNPREYFRTLDTPGKERYARRASVSLAYLRVNVFPTGQREPRQPVGLRMVLILADASEGLVSRAESLEFFVDALYPEPQKGRNTLPTSTRGEPDAARCV